MDELEIQMVMKAGGFTRDEAIAYLNNRPRATAVPQLFMGVTTSTGTQWVGRGDKAHNTTSTSTIDDILTADQAYQLYNGTDATSVKLRNRFDTALNNLGLAELNVLERENLWKNLVDTSAEQYSRGMKISPWDVLALSSKSLQKAYGVGGGSGPKTYTTTYDKSFDAASQRDTIDAVYKQLVGRTAKPDEIDALIKKMNAAYDKNPTKQITTTDGKGNTTVKTVSGFSDAAAQQLVKKSAKTADGYAEFQNDQFGDWLMSSMTGQ